jgi:hypothetical protein
MKIRLMALVLALATGLAMANPVTSQPIALSNPDFTARLASFADVDLDDPLDPGVETRAVEYKNEIALNGDDGIRTKAAETFRDRQYRDIMSVMQADPEVSKNADYYAKAARYVINKDIAEKKEYALEQQALAKLRDLAATDPTQAKVQYDLIVHGSSDQMLNDMAVKSRILQREVEKPEGHQMWLAIVLGVAVIGSAFMVIRTAQLNSDPLQKELASLVMEMMAKGADDSAQAIFAVSAFNRMAMESGDRQARLAHALSMCRPMLSAQDFGTARMILRSL